MRTYRKERQFGARIEPFGEPPEVWWSPTMRSIDKKKNPFKKKKKKNTTSCTFVLAGNLVLGTAEARQRRFRLDDVEELLVGWIEHHNGDAHGAAAVAFGLVRGQVHRVGARPRGLGRCLVDAGKAVGRALPLCQPLPARRGRPLQRPLTCRCRPFAAVFNGVVLRVDLLVIEANLTPRGHTVR